MADLLQIFTGNPLSTFVGKKIEAATKPELESEDWALNMEICDVINENDDDAKDAALAIKKRLQQIEQDRNFTVTNRTLTVLETCVSNCSHRFHILVMTKDFIQGLVKLIGPKNNPPIDLQERVLSLIERWADAFRSQPDLSGVVSVYTDLKAKGVTFPARDPNSHVPIQTPQRTVPSSSPPLQPAAAVSRSGRAQSGGGGMVAGPPPMQQPGGQVLLEGEGYNKISQDLVVVQSSIEMFEDIMRALESPANEGADWKLADELSITCRQMKDRIVDLIERIANEDLTIELLRLNDELNTVFTRYETLAKKRPAEQHPPTVGSREQQSASSARPTQPAVVAANPTATTTTTTAATAATTSTSTGSRDPVGSAKPKLSGVSSSTLNELSQIDFNAAAQGGDSSGTNSKLSSNEPSSNKKSPSTYMTTVDPFDTSSILTGSSDASNQKSVTDRMDDLNISGPTSTPAAGNKKAPVGTSSGQVPEEVAAVREQDFAEIENWLSTDSGRDLASISADMPSIEPISVPNSEFENFIASRALAGSTAPTTTGQQQPKSQQPKPEPSV